MIVADTSALVSLASIETLDIFLTEFDVHTTETVVAELEETGEYDDTHGNAARMVLDERDRITTHRVEETLESSRIDHEEGSCAFLAGELDAEFLITDDLRALPELQNATRAEVAISPIVLKALVTRDRIGTAQALDKLAHLAQQRSWLGQPIYTRAKSLFE